MQIFPKSSEPVRPESDRQTASQPARDADTWPVPRLALSVNRFVKLEIADGALDGRDRDDFRVRDPNRAGRIRGRVLSGAYDTLEVVEAVSRRLLDSGDL
jgi:hypothetical protein